MKNLLLLAFCIPLLLNAQQNSSAPVPFDEKAAAKQAELKGIHKEDIAGYVGFLKRKYYAEQNKTNTSSQQNNYKPSKKIPSVQSSYCVNAGFENLDFTNWTAATGGNKGNSGGLTWTGGISSSVPNASLFDALARHTILTAPPSNNNPSNGPVSGYDSIAINPNSGLADIPLVAPNGGGVSVRLGNAEVGAQAEKLTYAMSVTSQNTMFVYQYAVVLQDPGHPVGDNPFFTITVKDQSGTVIGGACGVYNITSALAASDTSFIKITSDDVYYKKWTLVGVDLSGYIGQTITVEFVTADCAFGGHYGYAYIDASCGGLKTLMSSCSGDTTHILQAPPGFTSYQWKNPSGTNISGATNDSLVITNGNNGDVYSVKMTSAAGCSVVISTTLQSTSVTIQSVSFANSCKGASTGMASVFASGSSKGYNFLWSNGATTQSIYNIPPGTYSVHVWAASCGADDTTVTIGLWPSVLTKGTAYYCGGVTYIHAPAGSSYQWYSSGSLLSGQTKDSLLVSNPNTGDAYIVTYSKPGGCRDSLQLTLAAPDSIWSFPWDSTCGGMNAGSALLWLFPGNGSFYSYSLSCSCGYNAKDTSYTSFFFTYSLYAGTYTVTVSEGNCAFSSTFIIPEIATITNYSSTDNNCYGELAGQISQTVLDGPDTSNVNYSVNWYGPGGYHYTQSGVSLYATVTQNNLAAGTYTCIVSWNGCSTTDTIIINQPPAPPDTLQMNTEFCDSDLQATLYGPEGFTGYEWYFNGTMVAGANADSLIISNPAQYSQYKVSYLVNGCRRNTTVVLKTTSAFSSFTVNYTNIFTPNNDGANDLFYPFVSAAYTPQALGSALATYNLTVYNRWGTKIYDSNSYSAGWPGSIKGKASDDGIYFWVVSYSLSCSADKSIKTQTGFVQLIR